MHEHVGDRPAAQAQWAKVIDQTRCIGCHACTTACKSENLVPLGVTRTYVKHVEVGEWPQARRAHQVTRCNQCAHAPCVQACPTAAMFKRPDGIVDFDKSICIGCKACMAACPYDAIFINPEDHSAEKCNFCAHRIDVGLEPACVVVCPVEAILIGDLRDTTSRVAQIANREPVNVRRPEKETAPKLFYKGAHQATLDPLAARRPGGGLFMWSEQKRDRDTVNSGNPAFSNTSAAALLSYDVPHSLPWDWRVSLYTWTKSIAAGVYLVMALLAVSGLGLEIESPLWRWVTPVLSGVFLAITGALLIWDLEHPARFYMIFTRPQWRSWLVKGAFVIAGYSLVLALHFLASLWRGSTLAQSWLLIPGVPLAALTAVYTAYLFAQAKARDLWQNPLLPPHLFVQAVLAGSAALLPFAAWLAPFMVGPLLWILAASSLVHLLMVWGEVTLTHPTAHARLAVWEMTKGRYRAFFWSGIILMLGGLLAPWLGLVAAPLALGGLLMHEHAYVQSGQAVPLA
ncbi:MAG TPA: 4Fe-4S dicluster domain-containing protein [Pyrinomonadaceae bacterium]|jgi:Fe-S-cluster-containing dehydrogenase component/formate-dependent nitrite reductase membrane component NrfD|nr:4Fe-4S dicluster domain-containing protein [Pyrinomonadaceae bacterium]